MPDIKTRDAVNGTVKVIGKSAVAAERMKDAYVRTKDKAEHSVFAAESSPEEYAANRTLTGTETAVHEVAHGLDKVGRKGIKTTKENISKAKAWIVCCLNGATSTPGHRAATTASCTAARATR